MECQIGSLSFGVSAAAGIMLNRKTNATLHPSSLDFTKAVVAMDTDAIRGPSHIREPQGSDSVLA
jgi:hypothetical protein